MSDSTLKVERASGAELLQRGLATIHAPTPGRLVEIGAAAGLVYAIQSARATPVKVGYAAADCLQQRLKDLQTGNPYRLRILASASAYLSHERRSHKALAPDRMTGEWFSWSPRVAAFVAALRDHDIEYAIAAAKLAKNRP